MTARKNRINIPNNLPEGCHYVSVNAAVSTIDLQPSQGALQEDPMRRKEKEIQQPELIRRIMDEAQVCRLNLGNTESRKLPSVGEAISVPKMAKWMLA